MSDLTLARERIVGNRKAEQPLTVGQTGILDLLTDFWRGAGLRVNA